MIVVVGKRRFTESVREVPAGLLLSGLPLGHVLLLLKLLLMLLLLLTLALLLKQKGAVGRLTVAAAGLHLVGTLLLLPHLLP